MLLALVLAGCNASDPPKPTGREGKIVCVDTLTGKPAVIEAVSQFPAVQPLTGKRTLMPGMYCSKCTRWHPVPPPDQINRSPKGAVCPKTGTPLTLDGPWPEP